MAKYHLVCHHLKLLRKTNHGMERVLEHRPKNKEIKPKRMGIGRCGRPVGDRCKRLIYPYRHPERRRAVELLYHLRRIEPKSKDLAGLKRMYCMIMRGLFEMKATNWLRVKEFFSPRHVSDISARSFDCVPLRRDYAQDDDTGR